MSTLSTVIHKFLNMSIRTILQTIVEKKWSHFIFTVHNTHTYTHTHWHRVIVWKDINALALSQDA